jgi:hypothetical protein
MTENQRLKIVMTQLGFAKQKDFANKINVQPGSLSDILREKPGVGVSNSIADKLEILFGINKMWLKGGQGSMFINQPVPKLEARPIRLADPEGFEATGDRFYELPDQTIIMQTPVIPYKAYGSYLRGHADPEFYEGLETMPVPVDIKHKGTYLIFEVGGESMVNPGSRRSIWPGEKIIGRDLRKDHWKYKLHINSNECWVIVHKYDGIVIKEITEHDITTGEIKLHSWNPDKEEYPDYVVSLNDVEQIFNVVDPFNKFG